MLLIPIKCTLRGQILSVLIHNYGIMLLMILHTVTVLINKY